MHQPPKMAFTRIATLGVVSALFATIGITNTEAGGLRIAFSTVAGKLHRATVSGPGLLKRLSSTRNGPLRDEISADHRETVTLGSGERALTNGADTLVIKNNGRELTSAVFRPNNRKPIVFIAGPKLNIAMSTSNERDTRATLRIRARTWMRWINPTRYRVATGNSAQQIIRHVVNGTTVRVFATREPFFGKAVDGTLHIGAIDGLAFERTASR